MASVNKRQFDFFFQFAELLLLFLALLLWLGPSVRVRLEAGAWTPCQNKSGNEAQGVCHASGMREAKGNRKGDRSGGLQSQKCPLMTLISTDRRQTLAMKYPQVPNLVFLDLQRTKAGPRLVDSCKVF